MTSFFKCNLDSLVARELNRLFPKDLKLNYIKEIRLSNSEDVAELVLDLISAAVTVFVVSTHYENEQESDEEFTQYITAYLPEVIKKIRKRSIQVLSENEQ